MSQTERDTDAEPSTGNNDLLFKQGEIEIREGDRIEHDHEGPLVATGTKTMDGAEMLTTELAEDNDGIPIQVMTDFYLDGSRSAEESLVAAIQEGIAEVKA